MPLADSFSTVQKVLLLNIKTRKIFDVQYSKYHF
jgi:hypothetical protein